MASNQRIWYRRVFRTAHKLLLDRLLVLEYKKVMGRVLVIGAGKEPYKDILKSAECVIVTDIGMMHSGLDQIADAHSLSFPDNYFDYVLAIEVFEHLHSPSKAASEIHRVLKPNGRAVITIPFMFRIHADPHDYQRLTKSGLELIFNEFNYIKVEPYGGRIHVISDIVTTIAKPFFLLRLINWVFCLPIIRRPSHDCPSGYCLFLIK